MKSNVSKYWLAVGPAQNWKIGLEQKVWGLPSKYFGIWQKIQPQDIVLFYSMVPIKGVIGYGIIVGKRTFGQPLWCEEVEIESSLWPLRLYFKSVAHLHHGSWLEKNIRLQNRIPVRRALQQLPSDVAEELLSRLQQSVLCRSS